MTRWMLTRPIPSASARPTRLTLTALEERAVPAAFPPVSNTSDSGVGSLREALTSVNASTDATNSISFIPGLTGTITLASDLPTITKAVAIQGPGVASLTVNGAGNFKLFSFDDGLAGATPASIAGLKISGGKNSVTGGGGVYSKNESVTIQDCEISGNTATGTSGGGVRADGGAFTLINTRVSNNSAATGGGVANAGATFVVTGSTLANNNATGDGGGYVQTGGTLQGMTNTTVTANHAVGIGGGLFFQVGEGVVTNSLVSSNASDFRGGGVEVDGGSLVLRNATVAGNFSKDSGGGVRFAGGELQVRNSTVAFNIADSDGAGGGTGGGLSELAGLKAKVFSSIFAKNQRITPSDQSDADGELDASSADNLFGVDTGLTGVTNTKQGNQVGSATTPLDPLLSALAANGGATQTLALQPTSPAKDKGNDATPPLGTDGRGAPFVRVSGPKADVGAFEIQAAAAPLVVTTEVDRNNAAFTPGDLSLREALRFAGTDAPTVTFAPALAGKTILLTFGELTIDRAVTVRGPGAGQLAVSGGDRFRVFSVTDGAVSAATVNVSGLKLTNGKGFIGGAVINFENLTLDGVTVADSQAIVTGGGIDNEAGGTLVVTNSTVTNNKSGNRGGGVANFSGGTVSIQNSTVSNNLITAGGTSGGGVDNAGTGPLVITNSTISGNKAVTDGGGVFNAQAAATVSISNSTISGNKANANGGGVAIADGTVTINNSTVAFNEAEFDGAGAGKGGGLFRAAGAVSMTGTIVARNAVGVTGASPDIQGLVVGKFSLVSNTTGWDTTGSSSNKPTVDPLLGPLQDNGGPTFTHALPVAGPATDPGFADADINPEKLTTDQRGSLRKSGASIDIGAFEFSPNTPPTITDVLNQPASANGVAVGPLSFTVGDAETAPAALTVVSASSNLTLVPLSGVTVTSGVGGLRIVTVLPVAGQSGTATITLTVTDAGGLSATDTFTVTVVPPVVPPVVPGVPPAVPDVPALGTPVLVGVPLFAAGSDGGTRAAAALYNADKSVRFTASPFGDFSGGVRVAAADFNGDGVADLVAGTGPGRTTQVVVLDGVTQKLLFTIDPFEANFTGGVYVTAGDVNGDGLADLVVTPDQGGGPRVRVFAGNKAGTPFGQLADFFGIDDKAFLGGARAAVADLNGDGVGDLVVSAGFGGGPRVAGFNGLTLGQAAPVKLFGDFLAFEADLRNGAFVTAGDLDGDGIAELVAGGGPGGGPRVTAFSGRNLLANRQVPVTNFFAGDTASRGGIRVAVKNLDGDAQADLLVGAGSGAGSRVTAYAGKSVGAGTPPELFAFDAVAGFVGGVFVG